MRLRTIAEAGLRSKTAIRDTAQALGDLIQHVYKGQYPEEKEALDQFLKEPDSRGWEHTSWVLDSLIQKSAQDPTMADQAKEWAAIKQLTSPVVTAAFYDIDPQKGRGTPLQGLNLGQSSRNKYKLAMGPQGYVAAMSNVGEISHNKVKDMLRTTAKSGTAIAKAAKKDMPGVKPLAKF